MNHDAIVSFVKEQKEELLKDSMFKVYSSCADCSTRFIFKTNDLNLKKVCICQSNKWIINSIVES